MNRRALCAFFLMSVICIAPTMASETGSQYKVASDIELNGKAFASPALVVKAGAQGAVSMKGDKSYVLRVSVQPVAGEGKSNTKLLGLKYSLQTEAGYVDTEVVAQPGKKLVISSGPLHVTVTVTPTSR